MPQAIAALFASRKFVIALLAVIVAGVLAALGKIPVGEVATFAGKISAVLITAIAVEDASEKFSIPITTTSTDTPPAQNSVVVQNVQKDHE